MKPGVCRALTAALIACEVAPAANALAAQRNAAAARTFVGPAVPMRWGPVQVRLKVKGKRIVNVVASAPTDHSRSAFINEQALPLLKAEVLKAQSSNVNTVSGATLTSDAYLKSLQAAMVKAHL